MNPPEEEGGGKRNLGGQEKFGRQGARLFAIRQECVCCHCLRCDGQIGVRWPIYRATILVSAILIQSIPIICGVNCIKTTDTKDNHLRSWLHKDYRH
jgi:hypothetical protein